MASSSIETRLKTDIWLVGQISEQLSQTKLPSKREVLCLFFHFKEKNKCTVRESAHLTTNNIMEIWNKARIPCQHKKDIVKKVESLFKQWQNLKKNKENKAKRSEALKQKEEAWQTDLDDLFDVAHLNALDMIKICEDREFLIAQRQKGRPGKMAGIDKALAKKEFKAEMKKARMDVMTSKEIENMKLLTENKTHLIEDTSESSDSNHSEVNFQQIPSTSKPAGMKRGRKPLLNENLAISLDVAKISDRNAAVVLTSTLKQAGCDPSEYNVNYSSIRRERIKHRQSVAEHVKKEFSADVPLTVHWDGKLLEDITGHEVIDRLPILVSGKGVEQLLGVPKLESGAGEAAASAVYEAISSWNISEKVKCMCFDTTAVNTGPRNGACILLEQKLDKELLWLPCRHHILELALEAVVLQALGHSSGPDILIFKRFKKAWVEINKEQFKTVQQDPISSTSVSSIIDETIYFATKQLEDFQPRDDYKELLELTIIFLGGLPKKGISFKAPAGLHRARWMAKSIYALKIYLFREQFKLSKSEVTGIRDICIFTAVIYVKYWFQAAAACYAPRNDLELLKDLKKYENSNPVLAEKALKKIKGHLWYLSEELVALAFFDENVTEETKKKMVDALKNEGPDHPLKRTSIDTEFIASKQLEDFVTSNTLRFFEITQLSSEFLEENIETWNTNESYLHSKSIVKCLKVVNDIAERGVALMEEYNKLLTTNEEQKQCILMAVKEFRKKYPNKNKSTLLNL